MDKDRETLYFTFLLAYLSWPRKYIRSTIRHSESITPLRDSPESGKPMTAGTDEDIWPAHTIPPQKSVMGPFLERMRYSARTGKVMNVKLTVLASGRAQTQI
jgi:hypothetical protein